MGELVCGASSLPAHGDAVLAIYVGARSHEVEGNVARMEGCKEVIESIVRSEVQLTSRADIVAAFAHATFLKYSFLCTTC